MRADQGLQALSIISWYKWLHFLTERCVPSQVLEVCTNSQLTTLSLCNWLVRQVCKDVRSPLWLKNHQLLLLMLARMRIYLVDEQVLTQKPFQTCSNLTWVLSNPASRCTWVWTRQSSCFLSLAWMNRLEFKTLPGLRDVYIPTFWIKSSRFLISAPLYLLRAFQAASRQIDFLELRSTGQPSSGKWRQSTRSRAASNPKGK